jgi:arsenate reductase-like glutaredoxin family protein
MTCQRAQGFLARGKVQVAREQDATKEKLGPKEALKLARGVSRIVAAKGKKLVTLDLKKDRPTDEELLSVLLGPSGNLRAPTLKAGSTLLIGFEEGAYSEVLGAGSVR